MDTTLKIFILDDSRVDREACIRSLKPEGRYCVRQFDCSSDLLASCQDGLPDCLLLDYVLPEMTGMDVFKKLCRLHPEDRCATILLTGNSDLRIAIRSIKEGIDDYLIKEANSFKSLPGIIHNAIEHYRLTNQAQKLSKYDHLTGLLNRLCFEMAFEHSFRQAKRYQHPLTVLFIDLDDFKMVNDSYSHILGDRILCEVATRLKNQIRTSDLIGRIGGDEFAIVLDHTNSMAVEYICDKLINAIKKPFQNDKLTCFIGCSIGIATLDKHTSSKELLQEADQAMYEAKQRGKNTYKHSNTISHSSIATHHLISSIKSGIDAQHLYFVYQPIFSLAKNKACKIEALLRWQYQQNLMMPSEFIGKLEKTHFMRDFSPWMIEQNLRNYLEITHNTKRNLILCLNVSLIELYDTLFSSMLLALLEKYHVPPYALEIEVTESHVLKPEESLLNNLNALRHQGIKITLDDFGSEYSSFSSIFNYNFHHLKIDKRYIQQLSTDNKRSLQIIKTIIHCSQIMNMTCVAEGIEHEHQLQHLLACGCDMGQGYYLSHPLSKDELIVFLNQERLN